MMRASRRLAFLAGTATLGLIGPALAAFGDTDPAYFCAASRSYYPAVGSCAVPWTPVARHPSGAATTERPVDTPVVAPAVMPAAIIPKASAALAVDEPVAVAGSVALIEFGPQQHPIECATLQVCDLALQAGERINMLKIGDAAGWTLDSATESIGASAVEHVFISPRSKGLDTSMVILTTMRTYHLRLTSFTKDYMALISFSYRDEPPVASAVPAAAPRDKESSNDTPAADEPVRSASVVLLRKRAERRLEPADTGDLVTVDGIEYVKGREPRALGENKGHGFPIIAPIYSSSGEMLSFEDPLFLSPIDPQSEPPSPSAAPRPSVDVSKLR